MPITVLAIIFCTMWLKITREIECKEFWQLKCMEIKSVVDCCEYKSSDYYVYLRNPKIRLNLMKFKDKISTGDYVYKPLGSFKFYIYKSSNKDSCRIVYYTKKPNYHCDYCNSALVTKPDDSNDEFSCAKSIIDWLPVFSLAVIILIICIKNRSESTKQ